MIRSRAIEEENERQSPAADGVEEQESQKSETNQNVDDTPTSTGAQVGECRSCFLKSKQIYSFIILALLGRSVQQVGGTHLRFILPRQHSSFRRNSDLTRLRFGPLTSRFRDERVTAVIFINLLLSTVLICLLIK